MAAVTGCCVRQREVGTSPGSTMSRPAKNAATSAYDLVASGEDALRYMSLARADSSGSTSCEACERIRKLPGGMASRNTVTRPRGILLVGDEVQERGEQHHHGPAQVDHAAGRGVGQDLAGFAHIPPDGGDTRAGGEQRVGVGKGHPVVIHVHHGRAGDDAAGYLVHVCPWWAGRCPRRGTGARPAPRSSAPPVP